MNVVIPMVGLGTRVKELGPAKPLIEVKGKTIVEHCINSLGIDGKYIFVLRITDKLEQLCSVLTKLKPGSEIVIIDYLTEGPASSALLAKELINTKEELIVTNCDQVCHWDAFQFLSFVRQFDGAVTTYPHPNIVENSPSPYSFVQTDSHNLAVRFEEKFAISKQALNGIHYWKEGKDFIQSAEEMIKAKDTVNNEFYVSKTFNYLLPHKKIGVFQMAKEQFHALGTKEEIVNYASL